MSVNVINSDEEARHTRVWIKKFGNRLRMIEAEKAGLEGIVKDLHQQLADYEARKHNVVQEGATEES